MEKNVTRLNTALILWKRVTEPNELNTACNEGHGMA